jgi:hypothetical protein
VLFNFLNSKVRITRKYSQQNTNNMKIKTLLSSTLLLSSLICQAQLGGLPKAPASPAAAAPATTSTQEATPKAQTDSTQTPEALLDKAVAAESKGDKAATASALKAGTAALEKEAKNNKGSLKDKLLGQVSTLSALIPLAESGMLGGGILPKAAGIAKLLVAHQRIEGLMGGASMLGSVGAITSNLGILKSGLSVLSPATQSSGNSLIGTAMSGLGKLSGGGPAANAMVPTVKGQLGSVLDLVKGGL